MFSFGPKITFLKKASPKNQHYMLKLKFGTCNHLNMLNSMVMYTFFILEITFWVNLVQKIKIVCLG